MQPLRLTSEITQNQSPLDRTINRKWVNIDLMKKNKIYHASIVSIAIFTTFQSLPVFAKSAENLLAQLTDCTMLSQDNARLQCFDDLAQAFSQVDVNEVEQPEALPENLGGGKFDKSVKKPDISRGRLASCKKSHDGRWFFIFENGQVWKQVNHSRRRNNFKNCDFSVAIKEDGFGYKMHIEELAKVVRVKRQK